MKHNRIIAAALAAIIAAGWMLTSCGHKAESSSPEAEVQRNELYEAMKTGDISRIESVADSLSLMTDDLTTDETVAVLLAFLQVHNDAAAKKKSKKDLVTIRKFVDVYDIASAIHGSELREAFNAAKELNGNLDLPEIAAKMREKLADYDARSGDESAAAEAAPKPKPDTVAVTTEQPVVPAE